MNIPAAQRPAGGLTRRAVDEISRQKSEPDWMRRRRRTAFGLFRRLRLPGWGVDLSGLDMRALTYYVRPAPRTEDVWRRVPKEIKKTFDRLGIPAAERKFFAGVGAQYDSEMVYHHLQGQSARQGVIYTSMDGGLRQYPDLVKEYFGTVVPPGDNKFAALNSAAWSGGSFVYVPKNTKVDLPLQAYFRINSRALGQFERTLIIADEGSQVHYIEGCTAPIYSVASLHSAVVEIIVKRGARVRYTTVQNWSRNVYNLVTKRAVAHADATMEWVDGNLGSRATMKYPSVHLVGRGARAEIFSLACATSGQHQDSGGRVIHEAPDTTSVITARSVSRGRGRNSFRGLVRVCPGAKGVRTKVRCQALLIDKNSRSDTYPKMDIRESAQVEHEASVSRIGEEQLFYLQSRGLSEDEATSMIVNGFVEPVVKELPLEYAVELNRLIGLEMAGAVA